MGENLNKRIDNLRKQSRLLLAQVDQNSKTVKNEVKKLYSQNLETSRNYVGDRNPNKGSIKAWTLRNDSSGVGGALRSNCFCNSPNQTLESMPNTSAMKKVLISSKKHSGNQHCSEIISRRPVKDCYCKVQLRSTRTKHKQYSPCKRCRNHVNLPTIAVENNFEKATLVSPISCETLRRVQRIDYAPKSQFLRNVRSKATLLHTAEGSGDHPETRSRTQSYHTFMTRKDVDSKELLKDDDKKSETKYHSTKSGNSEEFMDSKEKSISKSDKGIQVSLKKHPKPKTLTKRTLSSKTSTADSRKSKAGSKATLKSIKVTPSKECQCCQKGKLEHSEEYEDSVCVGGREIGDQEYLSEREMRELRKFREQNYFDTHGSSHTLVSSKSSGSLEQYMLNDRLFPEPVKRIHKKDLVVTMPPCATVQQKRLHYFPRYIVHQEKIDLNGNCKKKQCKTCPLTGHAIDLGITKMKPPIDSLALKYQKRLP